MSRNHNPERLALWGAQGLSHRVTIDPDALTDTQRRALRLALESIGIDTRDVTQLTIDLPGLGTTHRRRHPRRQQEQPMTTEHIDTEAFAFIARELTNHRPTEDTAEQVDGFTIAHGLDLREADEILGDPRPLRGGRIALWGAGAMVLFVLAVLAVAAELVRYWLP